MKLGRSIAISDRDVAIRVEQARKFLEKDKRVRFIQRFSGREIVHQDLGMNRMLAIQMQLAPVSTVVMAPKLNGRQIEMVLAPRKK